MLGLAISAPYLQKKLPLSKEDREKYDESLRKYRDTINVMEGQYLEGKEAGLAEGMEKGKLEIARSMKADKLPIETIIKYNRPHWRGNRQSVEIVLHYSKSASQAY